MNHNRSTALERSVKNYWGGGLKPVLGSNFKSEFEQNSLNSSSSSSFSSSSSTASFSLPSSFSSSSFPSSSTPSFPFSSSKSSDYANDTYEHPVALDLASKGINIEHLNVQGICAERFRKFSELKILLTLPENIFWVE